MSDFLRDLQPGQKIVDKYVIEKKIGEGGMGAVYAGRHIELGKRVAIKTLRTGQMDKPSLLARLKREAKLVARLQHPNIINVTDFGQTESGMLYLVMDYIDGESLECFGEKYSNKEVCRIACQVLKALTYAHKRGVIHRDIKPSNLMITRSTGEEIVKVVDFGIAKATAIDTVNFVTHTEGDHIIGSPHYMSPEQVQGEKIDQRTDLYCLGITLYQLATGELPYEGNSPLNVVMQHVSQDPIELPPELAGSPLGQVIARAVEKQPEKRYQTADEMLHAFERVMSGRTLPESYSDVYPVVDQSIQEEWTLDKDCATPIPRAARDKSAKSAIGAPSTGAVIGQAFPRHRRKSVLAIVGFVVTLAVIVVFRPWTTNPSSDDTASLSSEDSEAVPTEPPEQTLPSAEGSSVEHLSTSVLEVGVVEPEESHNVSVGVTSDPHGVLVTFDDGESCLTPCGRAFPPSDTPTPVVASFDGYVSEQVLIELTQDVEHHFALEQVEPAELVAESEEDEVEHEDERDDDDSNTLDEDERDDELVVHQDDQDDHEDSLPPPESANDVEFDPSGVETTEDTIELESNDTPADSFALPTEF